MPLILLARLEAEVPRGEGCSCRAEEVPPLATGGPPLPTPASATAWPREAGSVEATDRAWRPLAPLPAISFRYLQWIRVPDSTEGDTKSFLSNGGGLAPLLSPLTCPDLATGAFSHWGSVVGGIL